VIAHIINVPHALEFIAASLTAQKIKQNVSSERERRMYDDHAPHQETHTKRLSVHYTIPKAYSRTPAATPTTARTPAAPPKRIAFAPFACVVVADVAAEEVEDEELVPVVVVFVASAAAWKAVNVLAPVAGALIANTMPFSQCPV